MIEKDEHRRLKERFEAEIRKETGQTVKRLEQIGWICSAVEHEAIKKT